MRKLSVFVLALFVISGCSGDDSPTVPPDDNEIPEPQIRRVTSDPAYDGNATVSPDGQWVVFVSERGDGYRLWRVPFAGGGEEQFTTVDASLPYYSADGSYIYFGIISLGMLWRMPASGGGAQPVPGLPPSNATLSPDGQWFVWSDGGNPSRIWKRHSGPPDSTTTVVALTAPDPDSGDHWPAWSPDGSEIVFSRSSPPDYWYTHLYVMNADGSNLHPLTDTAKAVEDRNPTWSPDGEWIAFERGSAVLTAERIFKVRATGETADDPAVRLTFNTADDNDDGDPCWSPDGKWIVFSSRRNDNGDLYVMSANGEPPLARMNGVRTR